MDLRAMMDLTVFRLRSRPSGPCNRFDDYGTREGRVKKNLLCDVRSRSVVHHGHTWRSVQWVKGPGRRRKCGRYLGETLTPSGVHHCRWGEPSCRGWPSTTGATARVEAAAGRRFATQPFSCTMLGTLAPLMTIGSVWFAAEKMGALADCMGTHVCVAVSKNSSVGGTETPSGRSKTIEADVASGLTETL